jgi:hypothetical protein
MKNGVPDVLRGFANFRQPIFMGGHPSSSSCKSTGRPQMADLTTPSARL